MKTFKAHLREKLNDPQFKEMFNEEAELLRIGLEIAEARKKMGISQTELAKRAHVTQQQVSKIENGVNANVLTPLRVCRALSLTCRVNRAA